MRAPRAGRTEGGLWPTGVCRHTHVLFWRFCCFLSFNQTVHEKQKEKEEELRPAGTRPQHPCSHSHTRGTGTLIWTGLHRRTHTRQPDTTGTLTRTHTNMPRHTGRGRHRGARWFAHLSTRALENRCSDPTPRSASGSSPGPSGSLALCVRTGSASKRATRPSRRQEVGRLGLSQVGRTRPSVKSLTWARLEHSRITFRRGGGG